MLLHLGEVFQNMSFNNQVGEKLRLQWREAKKKLSFSHPSADIKIYSTESKEEICLEVTQEDLKIPFCDWCEGIMERVKEVMVDANIDVSEVKDVVLIGASGRFPKLRMEVEKVFNKKCCKIVNADEGVAIGAALLGAGLASVTDITPLSIQISYTTFYFNKTTEWIPSGTELPKIYRHTTSGNVEILQSACSSLEGNACHLKLNYGDEIQINISGILEKIDNQRVKRKQCIVARSNLSEEMFHIIQQDVNKQENHNIAESRRMEIRNLLEEKLRRILSLFEIQGLGTANPQELSPEDTKKLLLWLEKNPNESERIYCLWLEKCEKLLQILEKDHLERRRREEERLNLQFKAEREAERVKREEELGLQTDKEQTKHEKNEKQRMQEEKEQCKMQEEIEQFRLSEEQKRQKINEIKESTDTLEQSEDFNPCRQSNHLPHTIKVENSSRTLPFVQKGTYRVEWQEMNQRTTDCSRNEHLQEEKLLVSLREHFLTTKISLEELVLWKAQKDLIQGTDLSDMESILILHQEAVLQGLAKDACVQVLIKALRAGCVLLTGKCQGPAEREFIFIAVRYISHEEPVECLLALVDSSVSGRELYNHFDQLCSEASVSWKSSIHGISLDGTSTCTEFYKSLRSEDLYVAEVWNSSHRLDEKIAQKCYSYKWGKQFFGVIDSLKELFMKDRWFKVLVRQCSSVKENKLVTYEQIVNLLYLYRDEVCKALTKIQSMEPKVFYLVSSLQIDLADHVFFTQLVVFHKILSVMKETSELLKFPTDIDIMVVTNCLSKLNSTSFKYELISEANKVRAIGGPSLCHLHNLNEAARTVLLECLHQCGTSLRDYLQLKGESNIDEKLNKIVTLPRNYSMSRELFVCPISFCVPSEILKEVSGLSSTHPCTFRAVSRLLTMPLFPTLKKWTVAKLQENLYKAVPYPTCYLAAIFILQSTAEEVHQIINVKKILEQVKKLQLNSECNQ